MHSNSTDDQVVEYERREGIRRGSYVRPATAGNVQASIDISINGSIIFGVEHSFKIH